MTDSIKDGHADLVVRRMAEADITATAQLDKEFAPVSTVSYQGIGRNAGPWLTRMLDKPEWDLFVAESAGRVVGFGVTLDFAAGTGDYLFPNAANTLWVMYLAVAKECQGRGVGRALYEHAVKIAAQRGRTQLFIDVASDNPITGWYERIGFKEIGGQRYLLMSINDQQLPTVRIERTER
jgi:ribosomal protein S18 acetylase RimI-like enzyme